MVSLAKFSLADLSPKEQRGKRRGVKFTWKEYKLNLLLPGI